ncbi:hypothetical protein [Sporolactobacillus terrae]|uniref:DNA replication protein DnaD n=1 Tax=Sporolactobacillus terrae TaxID=269673 RepID=A0A5K7WXS4_9BACL|nr:hypothetical protein [Sporolactobacillus terrae]BBN99187.1 hypothetical protein St703_18920 [Sporolactobacillus terrae]
MAKYRYVYTEFWRDPRVMEEMTPEDRYFYLYLLTNPLTTQCGIYSITKKQMAFDIGHSMESINSLVDRFEQHHKLIKYNPETREMAIIKWGKYNLNKAGKPMIDCLNAELQAVKDQSLINLLAPYIENKDIAPLFLKYAKDGEHLSESGFDESDDDTCYDTSTTSTREGDKNKNKNKNKIKNNKKTSCRANKFDDAQMTLAKKLFNRIREHDPNYKQPNLEKWANDIRLMMERDNRTYNEIDKVIDWCQDDSFWYKNILSTGKLREQFGRLRMEYLDDWKKKKEAVEQAKNRSPNDFVAKKLERERKAREEILRRYQVHDANPSDGANGAYRTDVSVSRE